MDLSEYVKWISDISNNKWWVKTREHMLKLRLVFFPSPPRRSTPLNSPLRLSRAIPPPSGCEAHPSSVCPVVKSIHSGLVLCGMLCCNLCCCFLSLTPLETFRIQIQQMYRKNISCISFNHITSISNSVQGLYKVCSKEGFDKERPIK